MASKRRNMLYEKRKQKTTEIGAICHPFICEPSAREVPMARVTSIRELIYTECRYCLMQDKAKNLIAPCLCRGTVKYVHRKCINEWISNSGQWHCSVCWLDYARASRRPRSGWRALKLALMDRLPPESPPLFPVLALALLIIYAVLRVTSACPCPFLWRLLDVAVVSGYALYFLILPPVRLFRSWTRYYGLCKSTDPI
ncbi:hypothetical protein AAG570_009859 [Ranatra chinensis]|uniref:RING-CH-type domain-containing protein n=1 Tax=Ranatra chinensis TaxID=642074 RepID=A0ABD0YQF9_9HEMI